MRRRATWAVLLSVLVIIAWGCSQTGTDPAADHPSGKSLTGVDLGMGDGGHGGGGCDSTGHGGGKHNMQQGGNHGGVN